MSGTPEHDPNVDYEKGRSTSITQKVARQLSVTADDGSTKDGQLYSMTNIDPALDAKMNIINDVCAGHPIPLMQRKD